MRSVGRKGAGQDRAGQFDGVGSWLDAWRGADAWRSGEAMDGDPAVAGSPAPGGAAVAGSDEPVGVAEVGPGAQSVARVAGPGSPIKDVAGLQGASGAEVAVWRGASVAEVAAGPQASSAFSASSADVFRVGRDGESGAFFSGVAPIVAGALPGAISVAAVAAPSGGTLFAGGSLPPGNSPFAGDAPLALDWFASAGLGGFGDSEGPLGNFAVGAGWSVADDGLSVAPASALESFSAAQGSVWAADGEDFGVVGGASNFLDGDTDETGVSASASPTAVDAGSIDTVTPDPEKPDFHFADCGCSACCEPGSGREFPGEGAPSGGGTPPGSSDNSLPFFTLDQVADQLTTGYWASVNGGGQRSFEVGPGGSLNVDITGLQANGQALAREALDAWTAVTGITFNEVEALPDPAVWTNEGSDAASTTGTAYSISVGGGFRGTLSTGSDRDAVAVNLVAGESYTIALRGDEESGNPLFDPYLRVYNASGNLVAQNDDAESYNSRLTFTAPSSGTFYLQAGSYADSYSGDYTLQIADAVDNVHISFGDQASGAYAQSTTIGTTILSSFINVNQNWTGGENRIDGYHYQTYLHEIGHALGLGHAGNYNGGASFGTDNHYQNDSWAVSLMSYFHQTENTFTSSSFAYAITPMLGDILAIQDLYGTPDHATGDTVYGRGGTSGTYLDGALDYARPTAWTVYDTGGTDHFDFSGYAQNQRLDLRDETWSDVAGLVENIAIARGTVIENGTTGTGDDTLQGNDADNALWSGAGADRVAGGAGHDAIFGAGGNDDLSGDAGFDLIEGSEGADLLSGGDGGDLLFGGDVTLADLQSLFPGWSAPGDAQDRIDTGEVHVLWDDILWDVFGIA